MKGESTNSPGKRFRGIFLRRVRAFARNRRGVSAVEFAVVFPVMAALYLGGTAITQGIVIKRKVTLATRTVGDLASQDTNITDAEMTSIFIAGAAVMQPYRLTTMSLTISSLNIDENGVAKVEWSNTYAEGNLGPGRPQDQIVTLPDGINTPNTHIILSEGSYTYTPPVADLFTSFISSMPLNDTFYLRPRRVTQITRSAS